MDRFWEAIDNNVTVPLLGAPLTVLGMAFGGAVASFAYGTSEPSRKKMFSMVLVNTFLATILVALVPPALSLAWLTPVLAPPAAGFVAFSLRFLIPVAIELAPQWVRRFAGSKSGDSQ